MSLSVKAITLLVKEAKVSPDQKLLLQDGLLLLRHISLKKLNHISDYSFVVAPFAKAYEGYLKTLFLETELITSQEYYSDYFRVGKVLNPNLKKKKFSVYAKLEARGGNGSFLAQTLWDAWKEGRNLLFHYFPHNLYKITFEEAKSRIFKILRAISASKVIIDKSKIVKDN